MQFKRLRLSGFKSFVDPTEFIIEPGLTGVVGPNGCGKSNLLEAIRWVMGENSPRRVRGEMMDDVIFSGTERRPARNLAEVTVLLGNEERKAPHPFNDSDEIEVSRRIEREAGSSYRINGRDVRAKDVQLLFADAATGAHSPALVSQGKVSALVSAKPEERRLILEEAAGISGLHTRRKEAETRLKGAETNLQRLDDIMAQMTAQADSLKKQARQATRYKNIAGHIRKTQAILTHLKWRAVEETLGQARTALEEAERAVAAKTAVVAKANTESEKLQEALPALRQKEAEAGAAHSRVKIAFETLDAEERDIEERIAELKGRLAQLEQDLARERESLADSEEKLARQKKESEGVREAIAQEKQAAGNIEERYRAVQADAAKAEEKLEQASSAVSTKRIRAEHIDHEITFLETRKQRLASDLGTAKADLKALKDKAAAPAAQDAAALKNARGAIEAAEESLYEAVATREATDEEFSAHRQEAAELKAELSALDGEIKVLTALIEEKTEGGKAAPVAAALKVEPGFEAALSAALGDDLEAPEAQVGEYAWRMLPPLGQVAALPGGATPLSQVVKAPIALSRRLSQTGIVEDGKGEALMKDLQAGQRLVSKEGTLWRWDGFVKTAKAPSRAALRILNRNKLSAIEKQRADLAKQLEAASRKLADAQVRLDAARQRESALKQEFRAADDVFRAEREKAAGIESETLKAAERAAALTEAASRIEADLAEIKEKEAELRDERKVLRVSGEEIEALEAARKEAENWRDKLAEVKSRFESWKDVMAEKESRLSWLEKEGEAWQERANAARSQIAELEARIVKTRTRLSEIDHSPERFAEKRKALLEQMAETEKAFDSARDALAAAEDMARRKARELKEAEAELAREREEMVRRQGVVEAACEKQAELDRHTQEEFGCWASELIERAEVSEAELSRLPDVEAAEEKLERLKAERERLGAVNLRADLELEELEKETARLASEWAELEEAIRRLRNSIANLNREGRAKLMEAFEAVNKTFGELFAKIFNGGKAYLVLTESEDPLEAGLDIMASPPGKKVLHRSLLSGGEQALTAITLIFAVFLTNPAPICVLDEVDAPLDDANIERFCDLVSEIKARTGTRFLIATHNAITMARVERLYGVTMGEQGVSQLVSVNLERAEELRALA